MAERPLYLTKSAFAASLSCPTKLYYYLSRYPSQKQDDPYLELLAEGGYIVGKMAQLKYGPGTEIARTAGTIEAVEATTRALEQESVTLFEAGFLSGQKLVFIDILQKRGKRLSIKEVKSKAIDSSETDTRFGILTQRGRVTSDWEPYLLDLAYQYLVLRELYPDHTIDASLVVPDKAKRTTVDGLTRFFLLTKTGSTIDVILQGDPSLIASEDLLTPVPLTDVVESLLPDLTDLVEERLASMNPKLVKIGPTLSSECRDCDYKTDETRCGYRDCWGELADVSPSIFELYQGTRKKALIADLIKQRTVSLFDFPTASCDGKYGPRQLIQIRGTRTNEEWIDTDQLRDRLSRLEYPLHFVDFEACRSAIPPHKGMRPYQQIAFQWSCHTLESRDGPLEHKEWLNDDDASPNFKFAETLYDAVGDKGTILTWSHFENTALCEIADQMSEAGMGKPPLARWLRETADRSRNRTVDLHKMALDHYFHPRMGGSTSLKDTLPAVWARRSEIHDYEPFRPYLEYDAEGNAKDPYETLPPVIINDKEVSVREGTGAIRAYEEMMNRGRTAPPEERAKWRALLLQYCKLDTIAMAIVWRYWMLRVGLLHGPLTSRTQGT